MGARRWSRQGRRTRRVALSQLQTLVQDSERKSEQLAAGIRHMQLMFELNKKQVDADRTLIPSVFGSLLLHYTPNA